MDELGHAIKRDSVDRFIRSLWGRSELRSEGPDCAQPTLGAHANCMAAGAGSIMAFIYGCEANHSKL